MNVPNTATYATYPSLVDRTVFITGGADGIGAAIVEEFVRQGSKVGFADINAAKGVETVERCAGSDPRHTPRFYEVDLVDINATQAAVRQAQADLGGLTVLVNNAASDERHTWEELSADDWDDRMNTNLRHYFFTIQAAAPGMIEAQNGSIINIGSSS
ncbi:SDR family NAD(P)-dependent oxidoreductase, partial [Ilumatobacter sp.]